MIDRVCIISACLMGLKTRYDGTDELREEFLKDRTTLYIPLCPEQLGGMPTPRPRAEIEAGDGRDVIEGRSRVITEDGRDITKAFLKGAEELLRVARITGIKRAVLKEGSPSCGVSYIKRDGKRVEGMGVTAALLHREGIELEGVK